MMPSSPKRPCSALKATSGRSFARVSRNVAIDIDAGDVKALRLERLGDRPRPSAARRRRSAERPPISTAMCFGMRSKIHFRLAGLCVHRPDDGRSQLLDHGGSEVPRAGAAAVHGAQGGLRQNSERQISTLPSEAADKNDRKMRGRSMPMTSRPPAARCSFSGATRTKAISPSHPNSRDVPPLLPRGKRIRDENLAEEVGFEPTVGLHPRRFSRPLP